MNNFTKYTEIFCTLKFGYLLGLYLIVTVEVALCCRRWKKIKDKKSSLWTGPIVIQVRMKFSWQLVKSSYSNIQIYKVEIQYYKHRISLHLY